MKEIINSILEITDHKFDDGSSYDGYCIETNQQAIYLLIDNYQSCCENWGYFMSQDNIADFIGQELLSLKIVDTALNVEKVVDVYEGGIMFVNLETPIGVLQFTAYNEHNGYYSHDAKVISRQLQYETLL